MYQVKTNHNIWFERNHTLFRGKVKAETNNTLTQGAFGNRDNTLPKESASLSKISTKKAFLFGKHKQD